MLPKCVSSVASPALGPRCWQGIKAQEFLRWAPAAPPGWGHSTALLSGWLQQGQFYKLQGKIQPWCESGAGEGTGLLVPQTNHRGGICPRPTPLAAVPCPAPTDCPRLISNSLTSDRNRNGGFWTASHSLELYRSLVIAFYLNSRRQPQNY